MPSIPSPTLVIAADKGFEHARALGLSVDVVPRDSPVVVHTGLRARGPFTGRVPGARAVARPGGAPGERLACGARSGAAHVISKVVYIFVPYTWLRSTLVSLIYRITYYDT